jgi:DNA invertase Pin-like site-specific DNA recombinase
MRKGDKIMKINEEKIQEMIKLYNELGSKAKVAKEMGISAQTVSKYLALSNIDSPRSKVRIDEETIKLINEKFKEYEEITMVAKELGCATSTVKKHLNEESLEILSKQGDDKEALYYYICDLFGECSKEQPVSSWNLVQMNRFKKQGMPYRGQLLALKYFFEVKKSPIEKANGSIGIIPYIWDKSKQYYQKEAKRKDEIDAAIQKQLEKGRLTIRYNPSGKRSNKKKKLINLNEIGE